MYPPHAHWLPQRGRQRLTTYMYMNPRWRPPSTTRCKSGLWHGCETVGAELVDADPPRHSRVCSLCNAHANEQHKCDLRIVRDEAVRIHRQAMHQHFGDRDAQLAVAV